MFPSHLEFIKHILEEADFIFDKTSGIDREDFLQDPVLLRAVIRSLEVIGEATKNVPDSIRKNYSKISWREMAGMRDKLIHHYFGIDYEILWDIVVNEVPELRIHITEIIAGENL